MSIPSLLLLFLLTTPIAFSYTVITITGKRIEGTLITEQESTILIKDTQGVLISFKKQLLDREAMSIANARIGKEQKSKRESVPNKSEPRLAEIAEESRKRRTGTARTLRLEDLSQIPELSVMGSEGNEIPAITRKSEQGPDEKQWERKIVSLKKEVNRLRARKISAEASCESSRRKQLQARTIPQDHPTNLLSTYKESPQCAKLEQIEDELTEAENRLDNAREEGRKIGISWQTLE